MIEMSEYVFQAKPIHPLATNFAFLPKDFSARGGRDGGKAAFHVSVFGNKQVTAHTQLKTFPPTRREDECRMRRPLIP
jgi:hypothetical protein